MRTPVGGSVVRHQASRKTYELYILHRIAVLTMTNKTISVSNPCAPTAPASRQLQAARVAILHPDGRRDTLSLDVGSHVVGRTEGSVLLPDDSAVSRCHARIDVTADRVTIVDLGSTRGTFDDAGVKLTEPRALSARQGVRIGKTRVVLLSEPSKSASGEQVTAETRPAIPAAIRARNSLAPDAAAIEDGTALQGDTVSSDPDASLE
jgi:pSer/pThr/pTyr-binding forkhead associated (FHA) protein